MGLLTEKERIGWLVLFLVGVVGESLNPSIYFKGVVVLSLILHYLWSKETVVVLHKFIFLFLSLTTILLMNQVFVPYENWVVTYSYVSKLLFRYIFVYMLCMDMCSLTYEVVKPKLGRFSSSLLFGFFCLSFNSCFRSQKRLRGHHCAFFVILSSLFYIYHYRIFLSNRWIFTKSSDGRSFMCVSLTSFYLLYTSQVTMKKLYFVLNLIIPILILSFDVFFQQLTRFLQNIKSRSIIIGKASSEDESPAAKMRAKRAKVLKELLSTEQTYVTQLQLLYHRFIVPLQRDCQLSHEMFEKPFNRVNNIIKINLIFLEDLFHFVPHRMKTEKDIMKLYQKVSLFSTVFKFYKDYISGYNDLQQKIGKVMRPVSSTRKRLPHSPRLGDLTDREKFQRIVKSVESQLRFEGLRNNNLLSLLILPIQRIPRYKLLLEQCQKYTSQHDTLEQITKNVKLITEVAEFVNAKTKEERLIPEMFRLNKKWGMKYLLQSYRRLIHSQKKVIVYTEKSSRLRRPSTPIEKNKKSSSSIKEEEEEEEEEGEGEDDDEEELSNPFSHKSIQRLQKMKRKWKRMKSSVYFFSDLFIISGKIRGGLLKKRYCFHFGTGKGIRFIIDDPDLLIGKKEEEEKEKKKKKKKKEEMKIWSIEITKMVFTETDLDQVEFIDGIKMCFEKKDDYVVWKKRLETVFGLIG